MNTVNNFIKSSLLSLLVAMFALGACTPQAAVDEPSVIEVASDVIQLPKEAGEKIIDVKSNEEQVVAVSNRDWVSLLSLRKALSNLFMMPIVRSQAARQW